MQGKKQLKRYRRLDRAERAAIQSSLDKGRSCRQMARDLGRSPSTVADEVARNRTVYKGPGATGVATTAIAVAKLVPKAIPVVKEKAPVIAKAAAI